ncbi:MAG: efflux transporter outer membrane subunit [Pseudomonadales bacterium]|nr:efflux transporter outer membrane subunit [Pseudomonadales bacterium]
MSRFGLVVFVFLFIQGCALTPDYERPELDLPEQFTQKSSADDSSDTNDAPQNPGESIANLPWKEVFQDPVLQLLIDTALVENKDLGITLSRVAQVGAQLTSTQANQYPFFDMTASAGRGRQSQVIVPGASTQNTISVMGNLSFEIDLWLKLSRATEAAQADLLASEAVYRHVSLSLIANVASGYLLLRDLDQRLLIAKRTVESRQKSLDIIQARYDKGTVPELDVNQAQVELAIAQVAIATFNRQIAQTEHALSILLGRNPGSITRGLALDEQQFLLDIPSGLPSELLQRRPDIVAAEQQLHAQTALVGVAEALRYPSISLTGNFGSVSNELSDLNFDAGKSWGVAGGLFAPIFNWGQLKAQSEEQQARAEEAMQSYLATLQQAFREVEDALISVRTYQVEYEAYQRQVKAARNADRLSRARYDAGFTDFLEVQESSRSLFSAELNESISLQSSLNAVVDLYKALGGGWVQQVDCAIKSDDENAEIEAECMETEQPDSEKTS